MRPAGRSAEYKQVTVLFADVVRSMDIAAAVGAERLREIMAGLVGRAATVVRRYGGTMEKFTGDGVMAIFGAPAALEDHAIRGCLAALAIQDEANRLAVEVQRCDGVDLHVRVGLNSGRVVAGEIGSGVSGYAAIGEQVGLAQRMESVAPPGGVMLSESTARLVELTAVLADTEMVTIKGRDTPVPARRLVAIEPRQALVGGPESILVGRRREIAAIEAMAHRMLGGRGGVVNVTGPPGIGKSRLAREAAAAAAARGVEVFWAFCESHASDIPFHALKRLLRSVSGIEDVDGPAARERVREQIPRADPQDLLLLDDLLGVADPEVALPAIDPDARRRRLTALINSAVLARTAPAFYIIEDAQWIDTVSESMIADFLTVIPHTPSTVLITSRQEYRGALTRVPSSQTIVLAPLDDSDTAALVADLLGADTSVSELTTVIADRAAGNPFFAEEIVRELAQRGVLAGERGGYGCDVDVADVSVPDTVQAAIEARIDRLTNPAKRMLSAASVIGARFGAELVSALGIDVMFEELLAAELIDQVRFIPSAEYAFRHPLIRAVAYESQLKTDRAQWHRRLATAIEEREPGSVEEDAALIAEHAEAAGEVHAAYGWHMRAGAWSTQRDLGAARLSWERARRIADALPADDPGRVPMRIGPRTMLCATDYNDRAFDERPGRFAELRELCSAAGDKVSLAIGMTGLATELIYTGRARECSRLVSEQVTLLESTGDPTLTIGLAPVVFAAWADTSEFDKIVQWSQTIIDLADGDAGKGAGFGFGSPLAIAFTWRGFSRAWLGRPGWRQDLRDAVAMARRSNPATLAAVVVWGYGVAAQYGAIRADDSTVRILEEAVRFAEEASQDVALSVARYTLAGALMYRDAEVDHHRGLELVVQARDFWLRHQICLQMVPNTELWVAREASRRGDRDASIAMMRQVVDGMHRTGRLAHAVWGAGVLVEALLERGTAGDVTEAGGAIDRLASLRADHDSAMLDITLLRLRALLARARGADVAHRELAIRYRAMAISLGFDGHQDWAEAMSR